jgi:beta-glucosidase/6-phospho-beta-glucosidase/beta-galactosidase
VSRLPHFTAEESAELLGSSDFLGINFYSSWVVYPEAGDINDVNYYADKDIGSYQDDTWYT